MYQPGSPSRRGPLYSSHVSLPIWLTLLGSLGWTSSCVQPLSAGLSVPSAFAGCACVLWVSVISHLLPSLVHVYPRHSSSGYPSALHRQRLFLLQLQYPCCSSDQAGCWVRISCRFRVCPTDVCRAVYRQATAVGTAPGQYRWVAGTRLCGGSGCGWGPVALQWSPAIVALLKALPL